MDEGTRPLLGGGCGRDDGDKRSAPSPRASGSMKHQGGEKSLTMIFDELVHEDGDQQPPQHDNEAHGKKMEHFMEKALIKTGFPIDDIQKYQHHLQPDLYDSDHNGKMGRKEFKDWLKDVWRLYAKDKTKTLIKAQQAMEGAVQGCGATDQNGIVTESLGKLKKEWDDITTPRFIRSIKALYERDDMKAFLDSLVFEVPFYDTSGGILSGSMKLWANRMISEGEDVILMGRHEQGYPIPTDLRMSVLDRWAPLADKEEFKFAFTTVDLFGEDKLPYLIAMLSRFKKDIGIYDSIITVAILNKGWHMGRWHFLCRVASGLIFVITLLWIALDARFNRECSLATFFLLVLCALEAISVQFLEINENYRVKQHDLWSVSWGKYFCALPSASYSLITSKPQAFYDFGMTIYGMLLCTIVGYRLLQDQGYQFFETVPSTTFNHHPLWIAFFLFFKLQQLLLKLLTIRSFGEQVLPAYYALLHKSSIRFLLFVCLVLLMFFFTYFTIPVGYGNFDADGTGYMFLENTFMLFVEIFQLGFSGDFDLGDLDGENQRVDRTSGDLLNPDENRYWHHGVCMLYMVATMVMNIGMLNIYIGILSNVYDDMYDKRRQIFEEFRAVYTYKALMHRAGWIRLLDKLGLYTLVPQTDEAGWSHKFRKWLGLCKPNSDKEGVLWIAYNPKIMETTETEAITSKLDELNSKLDQLLNKQ